MILLAAKLRPALLLLAIALLQTQVLARAASPTADSTAAAEVGVNDIRGLVTDAKTGEAIVHANALLKGTKFGAVSNMRGIFVIIDAPTGQCTVKVSCLGYKPGEVTFQNVPGEHQEVVLSLKEEAIEGDEIVVVGEDYQIWKAAEEVSQVTISPQQIAALPYLSEVDIFRSLQLLPGISAINDGSAGLYVRGGTPDQNLVVLDGMTVYHVDHFFGFFSVFNSAAIKDVQVFKGAYPAKYGGRLSSVVDLTGRTGDTQNFHLSLNANLLSISGVAQIPLWGKGSLLVSARRSYADFIDSGIYSSIYNFLSGGEPETQQGPGGGRGGVNRVQTEVLPSFYFYDFNAKLSYSLSSNDFLALSFYSGADNLDESEDPRQFSGPGGTTTGATRTNTDRTQWGNVGSSLKWNRQWSNRFFSDLTFSFTNYFGDNNVENSFSFNVQNDSAVAGPTGFKRAENNDVIDVTARLDNEWRLSGNHNIGFGGWFSRIRTQYDFFVNDNEILARDNTGMTGAVYLQDKWSIWDNLRLMLGVRGTYYDQTDETYIEPRASLAYDIRPGLTLKGAWGQNYQFINQVTNEDVLEGSREFWILSDSTLKPGFSEHYILGMEYDVGDYLFSIEGYYKDYDNLLEFTQRVQPSFRRIRVGAVEDNIANFFTGSGFSRGIEFLLQKKRGAFNGWASYTLGQVEYAFPEFDDGDPFPASHDRRHEVKLVGTYRVGRWNLGAAWVFATGQAYTAPESQYYITLLDGSTRSYVHVSEKNAYRLPDYHRLDLSASYVFENDSFDGELGVSIFNAYNRKNIWYVKYDLDESPVVITEVTMLGLIPSVFIKLNF